jgi:hypothetical protein
MTFELSWTEIVKCTLKCRWGNKEPGVMMRSAETGLAPADLRVAVSLGMAGSSITGAQWLLYQLLHRAISLLIPTSLMKMSRLGPESQ